MASFEWPSEITGGGSGVTSLNGQIGDLELISGANITITPGLSSLTISSTGGGVELGGAATSFSSGMFQYIDTTGALQAGDSLATRDSVTNLTEIARTFTDGGDTVTQAITLAAFPSGLNTINAVALYQEHTAGTDSAFIGITDLYQLGQPQFSLGMQWQNAGATAQSQVFVQPTKAIMNVQNVAGDSCNIGINIGNGFALTSQPNGGDRRGFACGISTNPYWFYNNNEYFFPIDLPTTGQYLYVSSISGTDVFIDWVTAPATGNITGSGANTQVTYWTSSSTVSGDNNFLWDHVGQNLQVEASTVKFESTSGLVLINMNGGASQAAIGDSFGAQNGNLIAVNDASQICEVGNAAYALMEVHGGATGSIDFRCANGLTMTNLASQSVFEVYTLTGGQFQCEFGDLGGNYGNTIFALTDNDQSIRMAAASQVLISNTPGGFTGALFQPGAHPVIGLGTVGGYGGGTLLTIDDTAQSITLWATNVTTIGNSLGQVCAQFNAGTNPTVQLGVVGSYGNNTYVEIIDSASQIHLNASGGAGAGVWMSGIITNYNGISGAGPGMAQIQWAGTYTGATGPITDTPNVYNLPAQFEVGGYIAVTSPASTGTIYVYLNWTDENGSQQYELVRINAGAVESKPIPLINYHVTAGPQTITTVFNSVVGTPTYNFYTIVKQSGNT